jgi:HNH endonuclease
MRSDLKLEPFRSSHVYSLTDQVYGVVAQGVDFDMDYINWLWFRDFAKRVGTPHKQTILHETIHAVAFSYLEYSTRKFPELETSYYQELLTEAGMKIPKWLKPDLVSGHTHHLDRLLAKASEVLVPSVFHVLFSDREFVTLFQTRIAAFTSQLKLTDAPDLLSKDGVFKRPAYLPTWLKAGIFHRDRGRCQHCWRDLTGLGNPVTDLHLDHIIPLAQSGSNDPTNFQLSCGLCNLKKGKKLSNSAGRFAPYW